MACSRVKFIYTFDLTDMHTNLCGHFYLVLFVLLTCECYISSKMSRHFVDILKYDKIKYLCKYCLLQIYLHYTVTFIITDTD